MLFFNLIYFILFLICFCAVLVILVINPIFSILFLIVLFFLSSICLFLFSIEFLGFLYLIIYVGAIAILFLFVIMLIDLSSLNIRNHFGKFYILTPIIFITFFLFYEQTFLMNTVSFPFLFNTHIFYYQSWLSFLNFYSDILLFGTIIYTQYFVAFLLITLLFFISLIGALLIINRIELIYKSKFIFIKNQDVSEQLGRSNFIIEA